jgi:peptide deformylase
MLSMETGAENKILRTICRDVVNFDDELRQFVYEMEETMQKEDPETGIRGVGLAANQVGDTRRIVLVTFNVGEKKEHKTVIMINPEILWKSSQRISMEEGCLSLPGVFENVVRAVRVQVKWQDLLGEWHERKLGKWDARILLHEMDHLNGKLFIDYQKS